MGGSTAPGSDARGDYQALSSGPSGSDNAPPVGLWSRLFGQRSTSVERPEGRWIPEEEAGLISRITFWWVGGLISLGNRKALLAQDLWDVSKQDTAESIAAAINQAWAAEQAKPKPSLARALWRSFGPRFCLAGFIKFVHDMLQFMSPVLLKLIVQFLQDPTSPMQKGMLFVCLLLLCNELQSLCIQNYFHQVYRTSIHVRAAIISLVYRKSLRISATARQSTSIGQIVNLQSNDAEKLASLCVFLHIVWSGPLQIFGALGLLFAIIGVIPACLGFVVMLLVMPMTALMARILTAVRKRLIQATDARVKMISEVINGIKAIKLYAWEAPFRSRIDGLRDAEMKEIKTTIVMANLQRFLIGLNTLLVALTSLGSYALLGHPLVASVAFPALSLFNLLQFPLTVLPRQLTNFVQAQVAFGRLEKFLGLPETSPVPTSSDSPEGSIGISDGSFTWSNAGDESDTRADTLRGINLQVPPGQLLIVIGEVGSGKSSLLAAMLGEIRKTAGSIFVNGKLAYTSQDPWIQNATLQDNILMGRPMDRTKYERVLDVCALREDLLTLPGGDQAEIGEKGINLSGGQKHRVALARAVYSEADIYLLDDPLSAVDTHVGRHLFDKCISGELKGATRVLLTHQLQYAEAADRIAVVRNGTIDAYGTFEELRAQGVDFSHFQAPEDQAEDGEAEGDAASGQATAIPLAVPDTTAPPAAVAAPVVQQPPASDMAPPAKTEKVTEKTPLLAKSNEKSGSAKGGATGAFALVKQEFRSVGKVKGSIYMAYFRSWGPGLVMPLLVLLVFTVAQLAKLGNDTWLAIWTEGVQAGATSVTFYLTVYCITSFTTALLSLVRSIVLAFTSLVAARSLHRQLLDRTLRLPMGFFDSQPSGRLVNRFARDTEQVDLNLPDTILSFLIYGFQVVFAVGIIVYVTPLFFFPLIPVLFVYHAVQNFYISSSRELKRLDSVARSPIFAHFGESVQGLTTIRAFSQQSAFTLENYSRIDQSTKAYFASVASNRWLGIRSEFLAAITVFGTAFFCVWAHTRNAGFAGLAITNALTITGYMNMIVRTSADLETQMNSVERVLEYSTLDTEAPLLVESNRPAAEWPTRGAIDAYNLVVRYRADLEPVLKNLSFSILGGEKVGVCGRTGCGKTTLMMTIYRIMELDSGRLLIDGVDVSTIGLYDLRTKLALVPQDPVVFSGTVRFNLDPFGEASGDEEVWEALRKANLAGCIELLPGKLDAELAEGGCNLSTGQRQLLCMARALLRHRQVLILDEATSNVDSATDTVIQSMIRGAFKHCTVLTIAHRLHTIIDSDRVLLLDNGQLAEFDSPAALLSDDSSKFTGFVSQTLPKEAAALRKAASAKSARRSSSKSLIG